MIDWTQHPITYLMHGDCLIEMNEIPDQSVDMVLCDLPYGTTRNSWDTPLPLDKLWEQYNRICKPNACIALFSQPPYTADLIKSNKNFRYEWIWVKPSSTGFLNANKMPLKSHENILIFYNKLPTYNPQMVKGELHKRNKGGNRYSSNYLCNYTSTTTCSDEYYPTDILEFKKEIGLHPTQKPVPLCEYLIKTYTNPGDTVLDNCMGSGSTGVAAYNLKRNFIGIECNFEFFKTAENRLKSL